MIHESHTPKQCATMHLLPSDSSIHFRFTRHHLGEACKYDESYPYQHQNLLSM